MKDRISQILKTKNITATQFADELNVQRSGISHILSGRNNPSLDFVMKIKETYPEFNLDWLIMGKGPATGIIVTKENRIEKKPDINQAEFVPDLFSITTEAKPEPSVINQIEKDKEDPIFVDAKELHLNTEKKAPFVEKEALREAGSKKIIRLITLYNDATFDSYEPNQY